uniref:FTP domain-containing protein n=1 Tax=Macrostomum lignano TaxID=282301 RepID=A0A1I8GQN8_9PLAT
MQKGPWWQASTNRLAHIRQVRIYARLCGPVCSRYLKDLIIKVDGHVCARYTSTKGYLSTHTFECNRVGQVVEIRSRAKTYLMLCEVQVFGNYASLAHKGHRAQLMHTCRRAIDNNFSQYWSGKSCAHTQLQKNPWWQANTNRLAHIQQVRIYTRLCTPPCRVNFRNIVVKVDGRICARHKGVGLGSTITLNCNRVGQVVEIQAMAQNVTYLMLCEVQVFGTYASLAHKGALLPLKHCSQSSTHTPCARAIDGKLAQHFPAKSCSHTKMQTKPWWQAKTIKPAFIQQVRIYARLCGRRCARVQFESNLLPRPYLMLCEVQVFGRYGRKPPTHIEPGTGEETGTHETGTTGESGSPSGHGETGEVVSFERHCIDGHDSSEHKLGTSWTTKGAGRGLLLSLLVHREVRGGPCERRLHGRFRALREAEQRGHGLCLQIRLHQLLLRPPGRQDGHHFLLNAERMMVLP